MPAYPSPSMGSDTISEETSTPSDTAFISPVMNARGYPSHRPFPSLDSHSDFATCVDPTDLSTAQSPQNDGGMMPADAGLTHVDVNSTLYNEFDPGVVPPHQPIMESTPYMQDVVDDCSPVPPALGPGQNEPYVTFSRSRAAAPQPLGTGLSPASFLSPQNQVPVVIPRASSQGSTKLNTCLGRGLKADGEKSKEVYPCLFQAVGCSGGFPGKNEWKRHVNTIHVRWEAWVCAEGDCASLAISWDRGMTFGEPSFPRKGRVFNRKDLYIMHLGRRHRHLLPPRPPADKKLIAADQERVAAQACHRRIQLPRDTKDMTCSVMGCNETFGGSSAWDSFLEHVADHLKKALECSRGPAAMGSWIDSSLKRFGVSAGFLYEDEGGQWKLRDPTWNDGSKRKKGHRKRSSCQREDCNLQRPGELEALGPPCKRVQSG
ncbi:hypothetical protein HRG_007010 [Hirsutella rhossiliensis]|uniref:C2H2-type domain-containing protein n=1 Tax=Hirsutella rhossiliensis TaxID=111463 RepID=A0A9P8MVB3_9HYPO|nr:uncharacterized protein HRG_07010 [Hirsutella rhossiliensis]KAH0961930.1 hypothetical protein HRG_07010 [Hirsutella rhossiliensis]